MQHEVKPGQRLLFSRWGLAITGLAVLGFVALTPSWASAEGATPLHFTSPLNPPTDQRPAGPNDELHELLDSIIDREAILAEVLGITTEELEAAREAGTKLDELINEAGLDKETVREAIKSATEAAIDQAVTDGTITEEQAEELLNPPAPPERSEHGRGHRGQRPPGGSDGENPEQPGGTIPSEPGGTIPADDSSTTSTEGSATASASSSDSTSDSSDSSSDDSTTDTPPQRPERGPGPQGDGNGGGRRGPRR